MAKPGRPRNGGFQSSTLTPVSPVPDLLELARLVDQRLKTRARQD
jgi:hypothetical protein